MNTNKVNNANEGDNDQYISSGQSNSNLMSTEYVHHIDAAHGWVEVSKGLLQFLGIERKISSFSYMNGTDVYLEEDSDFGIFSKEYQRIFGQRPTLFQQHSKTNSSPIREYEDYDGEKVAL